jgi:hypothetical protein
LNPTALSLPFINIVARAVAYVVSPGSGLIRALGCLLSETMTIREIETPELHRLIGYLETLSERIRTGEVFWEFEARLFEYEDRISDIRELIKSAYPDVKIESAQITEGSVDDMRETLEHELGHFLPQISTYLVEMWSHLKECIDYEEPRICEYFSSEKDGLLHGILGDFAIIIYNDDSGRCLFLLGATDA